MVRFCCVLFVVCCVLFGACCLLCCVFCVLLSHDVRVSVCVFVRSFCVFVVVVLVPVYVRCC